MHKQQDPQYSRQPQKWPDAQQDFRSYQDLHQMAADDSSSGEWVDHKLEKIIREPGSTPNIPHHPDLMHLNEIDPASALMEENEKERALELSRIKSEQALKDDYDQRIIELTSDYKAKLKDLDSDYHQKKFDLDRERAKIERGFTMARDPYGLNFSLDNPQLTMDP